VDVMIDNSNQFPGRTFGQDLRRVALVTASILLVPFVAMRFTNEVNWTVFDFIVAGILLGGTGLAYILLARRTRQAKRRIAIGAVLLAALLLVWAELAVGLVGTPFAGT
jgi:peptidoglycan/LPS O-acetylase OafA/YrhL